VTKLAAQRVPRNLGERAGKLDTGRSTADDRKAEPGVALAGLVDGFRTLERQQQPPTDGECIVERLEPRRVPRPVVVPEIAVRRAAREHQIVEAEMRTVVECNAPRRGVYRDDLPHPHLDIALPTQDVTQRCGNVRGGEPGRRHLVEQRLEEMMVAPVEQRDPRPVRSRGRAWPRARRNHRRR
jgi:hypothetical protein